MRGGQARATCSRRPAALGGRHGGTTINNAAVQYTIRTCAREDAESHAAPVVADDLQTRTALCFSGADCAALRLDRRRGRYPQRRSSAAAPFSQPAERAFTAHEGSDRPGERLAVGVAAAQAHAEPSRRVNRAADLARSELGRGMSARKARFGRKGNHGNSRSSYGDPQVAHGALPLGPVSTADGSLIRARKGSPSVGSALGDGRGC